MKVRLTAEMLQKLLLSADFKIDEISDYFHDGIFTVIMPYDNLNDDQIQKIKNLPMPFVEYHVNVEKKNNYKVLIEFEKIVDVDFELNPELGEFMKNSNKELKKTIK